MRLSGNANKGEMIKAINELYQLQARNKITVGPGLGMHMGPTGNHIALLNTSKDAATSSSPFRMGRVLSYDAITSDQWRYYLSQVYLDRSQTQSGGRLRTSSLFRNKSDMRFHAWNLSEDINITTTGIKGNGVDFSEGSPISSTSQRIQPCPIGAIVLCVRLDDLWFFMYENGIDGECAEA